MKQNKTAAVKVYLNPQDEKDFEEALKSTGGDNKSEVLRKLVKKYIRDNPLRTTLSNQQIR